MDFDLLRPFQGFEWFVTLFWTEHLTEPEVLHLIFWTISGGPGLTPDIVGSFLRFWTDFTPS